MSASSATEHRLPLSVGLIGVTGFGRTHYADITRAARRGQVRLSACTVINPGEAREQCASMTEGGCRIYSDHREMLAREAGNIDVCFIPTGIPLHRPMVLAAVEAGCHVFVEKPAAGCVDDVDAMLDAARAARRVVAVGFQRLYAPEVWEAKRMLLDGAIGRVTSASVIGAMPRNEIYYSRNSWAGRLRTTDGFVRDSPFNNAMAHQLMAALFLAGDDTAAALEVTGGTAELYRARDMESPDTACFRLETKEGPTVSGHFTHACARHISPIVSIRGEKGRLEWSSDAAWRDRIEIHRDGARIVPVPDGESLRDLVMNGLLAAVSGNTSPPYCSLQLARAHTKAVELIHAAPVMQIPVKYVHPSPWEEGTVQAVNEMESYIETAFRRNCHLTDLDVPWAVPPSRLTT